MIDVLIQYLEESESMPKIPDDEIVKKNFMPLFFFNLFWPH